ncbi:MAG: VCBS domain-containing protein [Pirellulales bacterium]
MTIHGADDTAVPTDDQGLAVEAGGIANATSGSNATGNVLTNDSDVDAGDTQSVVGVASGTQSSAVGQVGSSVTGTYGSLTLQADGSYTYVVDESNATVKHSESQGKRSVKSLPTRNKERVAYRQRLSHHYD